MNLDQLKNKKILIVGYGKEGHAVEAFVKKYLPHASYAVVDQKDGKQYLDKQNEFDIAIKSPGVPPKLITIPYTTGTNLFFQNIGTHITIGVTGTKGKSTTTSLIYQMIKESGKEVRMAGNIGKPLIGELLDMPTHETIYVCELSSYQLADIEYSPHISVVVSLFPEHMNYHGSVDAYFEAKHAILARATAKDFYVYNSQFLILEEWAKTTKAKAVPYDSHGDHYETRLKGEHNRDNIKAAVTVARLLEIPETAIEKSIRDFVPLPHRLEFVGTFDEIDFYDDAISTTPESTIAALQAIPSVKTLLLGGLNRGYDFTFLIEEMQKQNVENVVLFPESGDVIEELLKLSHISLRILKTKDMKKAVSFAYDHTEKGSVCLLSTASPSYSVWKNFEEKGDLFQQFVKEIGYEKQNKTSHHTD